MANIPPTSIHLVLPFVTFPKSNVSNKRKIVPKYPKMLSALIREKDIFELMTKTANPRKKKMSCFGASAGVILESVKILNKPSIRIVAGSIHGLMSMSIQF